MTIRCQSSHSNGSSQSQPRSKRTRARVSARGRRFSPEDHARALSLIAAGMKREEVAKTIGCTTESLRRWYQEGKRKGLVTVRDPKAGGPPSPATTAEAPAVSSAPHDPGAGLGEHETRHGKPERVYTDRGAAFTAWRDVTSCEQFLDEQVITDLRRPVTSHPPAALVSALLSSSTRITHDNERPPPSPHLRI